MKKCPHCGSAYGVYTKFHGVQLYSFDGQAEGYEMLEYSESKSVYCQKCNRRIGLYRTVFPAEKEDVK